MASTQIEGNLTINTQAASEPYSVTVTNPDGGTTTFNTALNVLAVPPTPQGLSAVVGNGSVHLRWNSGQSLPEGYNVYVNGALANVAGPIKDPGFGVTGLQNGQPYQLQVTAVSNGSESARSTIVAEPNAFVAPPHPLHPILFLHGINADATAWETTADFLTNTLGWTCGGTLAYSPTDDPTAAAPHPAYPSPTPCDHTFNLSGDYFTTDFGDNLANYKDDPDSRGIFRQGDEVGGFIQTLQKRGPLSVVAWSMGGLAARSYMQISDPIDAASKISDLITLGTPHWGVNRSSFLRQPLLDLLLAFWPSAENILPSRGLVDMGGGCVANGDSDDLTQLSPFLYALDHNAQLPTSTRYVAVSGAPPLFVYSDDCNFPNTISTDLVVPVPSSTFTRGIPELLRNDNHLVLPTDISAILCALDQNCLEFRVFSPVDIKVTAPSGSAISNNFTSMAGADYTTVTDTNGHEIATVLIPFPQGGQYTISLTPKPGAQATDTFTILQTQDGVTTAVAQNMPIANIPSNGFQTAVKNGSKFTVNFGGSVQQPLTNDGQGHFVATVTITNQGNITVDSVQIAPANTKLGTSSAISVSGPITRLAPGASAAVTLMFPITSPLSTATNAPLKITGTYSAGILSGNWGLTFRSVTLGTSIVGEN